MNNLKFIFSIIGFIMLILVMYRVKEYSYLTTREIILTILWTIVSVVMILTPLFK